MKAQTGLIVALTALSLITGCASSPYMGTGALLGGGVGAIAGAAIDHHNPWQGALVGGLAAPPWGLGAAMCYSRGKPASRSRARPSPASPSRGITTRLSPPPVLRPRRAMGTALRRQTPPPVRPTVTTAATRRPLRGPRKALGRRLNLTTARRRLHRPPVLRPRRAMGTALRRQAPPPVRPTVTTAATRRPPRGPRKALGRRLNLTTARRRLHRPPGTLRPRPAMATARRRLAPLLPRLPAPGSRWTLRDPRGAPCRILTARHRLHRPPGWGRPPPMGRINVRSNCRLPSGGLRRSPSLPRQWQGQGAAELIRGRRAVPLLSTCYPPSPATREN